MGFNGPVALNDMAITNAMNEYFEVDKKDKLYLSLKVRSFFEKVMSMRKEE